MEQLGVSGDQRILGVTARMDLPPEDRRHIVTTLIHDVVLKVIESGNVPENMKDYRAWACQRSR